jgi:broad specificity phosphatase PhoE
MRRSNSFRVTASILLLAAVIGLSPALSAAETPESAGPSAVAILIRHAEKGVDPGDDPPLSAAGTERAQALATALQDAGVEAIITTQMRRTRDTAQPLATARGLTPEVVPVKSGEAEANAKAVAASVRRHVGGIVLVVGHTSTIPAIIAALGGPRIPTICESTFANLFILVPADGKARLVRSRYGAADPAPGPDCK